MKAELARVNASMKLGDPAVPPVGAVFRHPAYGYPLRVEKYLWQPHTRLETRLSLTEDPDLGRQPEVAAVLVRVMSPKKEGWPPHEFEMAPSFIWGGIDLLELPELYPPYEEWPRCPRGSWARIL